MPPNPTVLRPRLAERDGVVAAYSTRLGGASDPPYGSLNLGGRTGDSKHAVISNRRAFFGAFSLAPEQVAFAEQVHGGEVAFVDRPGVHPAVDGLVTRHEGIALAIAAADCAAVLLVD